MTDRDFHSPASELEKDAEQAYNYGAGFRYLIARKLGLGVGLDIAVGPEIGRALV